MEYFKANIFIPTTYLGICTTNMTSPSPTSQHPLSSPLLSSLFVFRNILNQELIRSVHVYKVISDEGEEERDTWVEREFIFSPTSCLEICTPSTENHLSPGSIADITRWKHQEGEVVGLWLCILAFDSARPSSSFPVPSILSFSRNPRLKSVESLANDLNKVFQLRDGIQMKESGSSITEKMCTDANVCTPNSGGYHEVCISHSSFSVTQHISGDQQNNINLSEASISMKKKRAATEHVASISLKDLATYFNLPIAEASRNLKVGLTVLKRKCREYGIPRWPHRKIKSLETLIHNVQEEVSRQELEKKDASAKAAIKRQQMLESEKKCIEKRPFMELQGETKRFRQDVFKRRHRAKSQNKELTSS